jgi:hypothetical protein
MRQCGDCNLCCKLLPVVPLGKGANERCTHQRHTGCRVYHKEGMPPECALWDCRWLAGTAGGTSRPDRSHIVIDVMPDFIDVMPDDGEKFPIEVIQCWIDPRYPDAHKDRAFRAFLFEEAQHGRFALIRFNARDAFVLVAPEVPDGEWREMGGQSSGRTHTAIEIVQALS